MRVPAQRRAVGDRPGADHDGDRLVGQQRSVVVARGERGVVGQHGAGSHDDRIGLGAPAMHVGARRRSGDPLAGAVGCRGPAVEALRPLDGDVRASEPLDGEPRVEERRRLVGEEARLDVDARGAQPRAAARRVIAGIGDGVDDPRHAGGDEGLGAGAGAAGVVAGLEGHDRRRAACRARGELRQRVDLGVRRAGAAVPALGDDLAVGREQHSADLRVHTARTAQRVRECPTHRVVFRCAGHPPLVS